MIGDVIGSSSLFPPRNGLNNIEYAPCCDHFLVSIPSTSVLQTQPSATAKRSALRRGWYLVFNKNQLLFISSKYSPSKFYFIRDDDKNKANTKRDPNDEWKTIAIPKAINYLWSFFVDRFALFFFLVHCCCCHWTFSPPPVWSIAGWVFNRR